MKRNLIIQCILVCALIIFAASDSVKAENLSGHRVIAKCAEAMGGMDKIKSLKALRLTVLYPKHDPVITDLMLPNKIRNKSNSIAIYDGKRACLLDRPPAKKDTPRPDIIVPKEEWKDFEAEFALFFPIFFFTETTYTGLSEQEGKKVHHLVVKLPYDVIMNYYIDAQTFLLFKVTANLTLGDKKVTILRVYSGYQESGGIKYPRSFQYSWGKPERRKATITSVEANPKFSPDHFKIPEGLK